MEYANQIQKLTERSVSDCASRCTLCTQCNLYLHDKFSNLKILTLNNSFNDITSYIFSETDSFVSNENASNEYIFIKFRSDVHILITVISKYKQT